MVRIEFVFAAYYYVMRVDFGNSKLGDFIFILVIFVSK